MQVNTYKKTITTPLRLATLCFLIKEDEILLAMKKRGFGQGKLNGVGGKQQTNESITQTAVRETQEEICVTPINITKKATLNFYFPHHPDWNQQVIVFTCQQWHGTPQETEEMKPKWYKQNQLPLKKMWIDDQYWLPLMLKGRNIEAEFLFSPEDEIIDYRLTDTP